MKLSFKYRLYPNKVQREALDGILASCRFLYNCALEERINSYKQCGVSLSYNVQAKELVGIVDAFPEFSNVLAQTRQQVLKTLDTAFQNFFRRVKQGTEKPGYPRFKNQYRFRSICFPQPQVDLLSGRGSGIKLLPNGKLKVFGIPGDLKVIFHRPFQGRVKQARILKEPGNKWFLVLFCDDVPVVPVEKTGRTVGIDLGLNTFIVASDGTKFHAPKPYKTSLEKLRFKQQKLAAKLKLNGNKRTNNVVRLRDEIARTHSKVANVRKDFAHKTANELFKKYDTVYFEDLDVQGMLEQKREPGKIAPLNRNIADAAWGLFTSLLPYKAERAGKGQKTIPPANTSKMCSGCGNVKQDLSLADRTYHCEPCGLAIDRDLNSAINIERLGTSLAVA
jgi:putative transposase